MQMNDAIRALCAAVLALLVVVGSAFLWIGIPVGGLWLVGQVTSTTQGFLLGALASIPLAMAAWGWLLYRVNAIYEGLTGDSRRLIDVAMTASAIAALVLMLVWFFFFAEMKLFSS